MFALTRLGLHPTNQLLGKRLNCDGAMTLQESDTVQCAHESYADTLIPSRLRPTVKNLGAEEKRPLKAESTHALLSFALETHVEEAGLSICPSCRKQDEGPHPTTASHLGELQLVVHVHTMLGGLAPSCPKCRTQTRKGDIRCGARLPVLGTLHIYHVDVELRVLQLERPTHEDIHLAVFVTPQEQLHQSRPRSARSA